MNSVMISEYAKKVINLIEETGYSFKSVKYIDRLLFNKEISNEEFHYLMGVICGYFAKYMKE